MSQTAARHLAGKLWSVFKAGLMSVGLVALVAWQVDAYSSRSPSPPVVQPEALAVLDAVGPARLASETRAMADRVEDRDIGASEEHKKVAAYLARRYKVAADATQSIVGAAYSAGRDIGVDPFLVLAVMAIESRMNPFAESGMGAKGLMQVIPKYHMDKFADLGGHAAVLNPVANIRVGTLILKDYLHRFGGVESGLRAYSGATSDDFGYAFKVLAERDRLKAAALGKGAPVAREAQASVPALSHQVKFEAAAPVGAALPDEV